MPTATAAPQRIAVRTWLARGLLGIAAGLALLAVLGPLVTGAIEYRVSPTLRHQTVGLDAVSLCLVAPLALAAAVLVRRGRALGAALTLPVGLYTAYMLLQYVLGPEYLQRPGNNERLFPLLVALFAAPKALLGVAGWFGLVGPAVAAMAIATRLGHDPGATSGATVFMTALGLAFAALAVWVFRPLRRA